MYESDEDEDEKLKEENELIMLKLSVGKQAYLVKGKPPLTRVNLGGFVDDLKYPISEE